MAGTALAQTVDALRRPADRPLLVDGGIALVLTVLAQAQVPLHTVLWLRACLLLATAALAWRRRHPLLMTALVFAGIALMGLSTNPPSVFGLYLAVMLAGFTAAAELPLAQAVGAGLVLVFGVVLHDLRSPQYGSASGIASDLAIPIVLWGLGRIVRFQRTRADKSSTLVRQLEQDQEELARTAVLAERAHLARELHDIVTHSLSVVVIQAQGAQRVLDGQPAVAQALNTIESAGRTALTEMRHLLGLLRDEDAGLSTAPQPGLRDLPALVDQVRRAGLALTFELRGESTDVPAGHQLAIYRVVQEALTNALKHAPSAQTSVRIERTSASLDVRVESVGGAGHRPASADGRGLLGMRERLTVYGGTLHSGPTSDGGYEVVAHVPLHDRANEPV